MKILIVDDEYLNCKLLTDLLKDFGECVTASEGNSAISLFKKALEANVPFDLVCLDIMLPEKSGHDVLHTIRVLESDYSVKNKCRVIMVTALNEKENKTEAFYDHCDGYLVKPIDQNLLFEMLNKMNLIK